MTIPTTGIPTRSRTNRTTAATTNPMLWLASWALTSASVLVRRGGASAEGDDGQATAEYALVLLGAAAIALAVISWATRTNLIGKLLDIVFGGLLNKAG